MKLKGVQESSRRADLFKDVLGGEFRPACDPKNKPHTLGRLVTIFAEELTPRFDSNAVFPKYCAFSGKIGFTARTPGETAAQARVYANFVRRATVFRPSLEPTAVILDPAKKIEGPRTDLAVFTDRISVGQMQAAGFGRDFSASNLNMQVRRFDGAADDPTIHGLTIYPIRVDGPRDCAAARAQILEQTEEFFDQFPAA